MPTILTKILLLAVPVALYMLVWQPLYTGVGNIWQPEVGILGLRDESSQYDTAIIQAEGLKSRADQLLKEYSSVDDETKSRVKVMVPDTIEKVKFVSELSSVVKTAGFPAGKITIEEGKIEDGKLPYVFSFGGKGSYFGFKQIVAALESSLRIYKIKELRFSTPERDAKEQVATFVIRGAAYHLTQ